MGTLLKWHRERRSCPALAGLEGYRVMYVSRGALGGKVFETGMVYVPAAGRVPRGGRPVMAWDHGTAGVGDSAAPSRYPWLYPEPASAPWDWYAQWVGKLGRMGYVVTCPDYEGLGTPGLHTYLHAASQGRATIDAVRAAKQLAAKLDVATSRRWGVAGHSQGGQAALAAAELAGTAYGKGLSLKATVAVAPAVEIATINGMSAADAIGWPYVGYTAWGIRALSPDFDFTKFCGPWVLDVVEQAPDNYYDDWWGLCIGAALGGRIPRRQPRRANGERHAGFRLGVRRRRPRVSEGHGSRQRQGGRRGPGPAGHRRRVHGHVRYADRQAGGPGRRLQYVILPGQRHDYALQFGWPWAKAFLEDRLPAR